jgi:hypothetical protein
MPTALSSATATAKVRLTQPNGNSLFPVNFAKTLEWEAAFSSGVGVGAMDRLAVLRCSIAASGTYNIDVSAGTASGGTPTAVVDLNGAAITFARIKLLAIELVDAASGSTGVHTVPAVANGLSIYVGGIIRATGSGSGGEGGFLWWDRSAGGIVVDGTHKVISIVNDDASYAATLNVVIGGGAT